MWLYQHHTCGDFIDLDHATGNWRYIDASEFPPDAVKLVDFPVRGSYEDENGHRFYCYWTDDEHFVFRTHDGKVFELFRKLEDGTVIDLMPGVVAEIQASRYTDGRTKTGFSDFRIVDGNNNLLYEYTYYSQKYLNLYLHDFTPDPDRRLADWDFFVALKGGIEELRDRARGATISEQLSENPPPMKPSDSNLTTYHPSGRISLRTIPVVLLLGLPVALLSGWIYGQLIVSSNWIPLSIFICAFAGTVIALCLYGVLKCSRSRSPKFNKYAAGMLAFIVVWARWITTFLEHGLRDTAINFASSGPLGWLQSLADFLAHLQTNPDATWWPWLVAGWLLEALFLISICSTIGRIGAEVPFSESAGKSADREFEGELFWPDGRSSMLLALLQEQGPVALLSFQRATELTAAAISSQWWTLRVSGKSVEADPAARWLDLDVVEHTRDEKGKISSKRTQLVESLCVSDADYRALEVFLTGESSELQETKVETAGAGAATVGQESATARPTPPELEPAVSALQAENYGSALALAQPHCMHPDEPVRADAYRLCALAHARLQQWPQAFEHYHSLFELEPTAFNAMQLATTSVTASQLLRGHAWFEKAEEINQRSNEIRPSEMRTQYISALEQAGEFTAAMPHLDWLADTYRSVRTSDDHQLWCYGLPFFQVFLDKSLPILRATCAEEEVRAWYVRMRDDLDDAGREAIDRHLSALA